MDLTRYDQARREVLPYVPSTCRRVLDVGCATGAFGRALRERNPDLVLWGVEPGTSGPIDGYDEARAGAFPDVDLGGERFDCIVFNDVLEHMPDPWDALRRTRELLAPGGVVVASIPNIRYYRVVLDLVVRGRWTYTDVGVLDRTHLRFFTRSTTRDLFERSGFQVQALEPLNLPTVGRRGQLRRLLLGAGDDFLALQYVVVASPRVGVAR